jgi:tetratricopeptide (TPR) repeat protein
MVAGLKLSPQNKMGWFRLVRVQLEQGPAGRLRALDTLERARQARDVAASWQFPYLVGLSNYMLDRHDAAVAPLREAVSKAPGEGPIHLLLAMCLTTAGDSTEAERHYRRALSLDGSNALFHYYYGLHLRRQRRIEEAAAEFRVAVEHDEKLAEAQLNLGLILDESGKEQEGIAALEKAAALAPDLARAYYYLGRIYTRRQEPNRASAMMRRYQELKAGEAEQTQRRILAGATSALEAR